LNKILVTGANGFVGTALTKKLIAEEWAVTGVVRNESDLHGIAGVSILEIGNIDKNTDWKIALRGIDAIVHTAARVHVMKNTPADPLKAYRSVNVHGTIQLARQAAVSGVRRFVFISTIKVNGEENIAAYRETDKPAPIDPYGISKLQAEKELLKLAGQTGMEVVVLRPPLIYGPGVRANFLKLLQAVDRGLPIPLARIDNRRSMIYIENFVDAIVLCLRHPKAAGQTFLVSDGQNHSTPDLIRRIAAALGRSPRLVHISPKILQYLARVIGKGQVADRLIGSLTVDDTKIRHNLGWRPPFTLEYGLEKTVAWYKKVHKPDRLTGNQVGKIAPSDSRSIIADDEADF
jgi:nucleoside-diphosphate-sugar epimerase